MIIFIIIVIILIISTLLGYGSFEGQSPFWTIVFLIIVMLFIIWVTSLLGFEINAIYENGITTSKTKLLERLVGNSFHRYENITKIGYGKLSGKDQSDFIVIFENHSPVPTVRNYAKIDFKNDFFEQLIITLKQKCPNATWENVNLLIYPKKYR